MSGAHAVPASDGVIVRTARTKACPRASSTRTISASQVQRRRVDGRRLAAHRRGLARQDDGATAWGTVRLARGDIELYTRMLWLADMTYSPFNTAAGGAGEPPTTHVQGAARVPHTRHTRATRGVETCLHAGQSALTLTRRPSSAASTASSPARTSVEKTWINIVLMKTRC